MPKSRRDRSGPDRRLRRSGRYPETPWASQRLYRPFIRAAVVVALTLGSGTGVALLVGRVAGADIDRWGFYAQAHGMTQLFGWTGLFVMGVASHVVPRFRGNAPIAFPWPQRVTLACVLAAIGLRWAGQAWPAHPVGATALLLSGALFLIGVAVFAVTIGKVLQRGSNSPVPVERWLWAGLVWGLAAALLHVWLCARMVSTGAATAPLDATEAFIRTGMFGFVGSVFLGVSLRAMPGFMGLRPGFRGLERSAFVLYQLGLGAGVGAWLASEPEAAALGTLVLATGLAAFIVHLRIFEPCSRDGEPPTTVYPRYVWFWRSAYAWAVVALVLFAGEAGTTLGVLDVSPLFAAAAVHVFALGVLTMGILGFAARLLPLFEARVLTRVGAMDLAFIALTSGVAMRIVFAHPSVPFNDPGLAASGIATFVAVAAFARAIWPLLGHSAGTAE